MNFDPYLFFTNNCAEAMTRYQEILGGDLVLLRFSDAPPGEAGMEGAPDTPDLIMHGTLTLSDGGFLMASDDPSGDGGPHKGVSISLTATEDAEARRIFDALADGGDVQAPFGPTFWSPGYGMCVDRFGVSWMVGLPGEGPPS